MTRWDLHVLPPPDHKCWGDTRACSACHGTRCHGCTTWKRGVCEECTERGVVSCESCREPIDPEKQDMETYDELGWCVQCAAKTASPA